MEDFLNWLKNNGCNINKLKIIDNNNNERGIISNNTIKEKELIFNIPKNLLITTEKFPKIKKLDLLFKSKTKLEKDIIKLTVLMLFLEYNKSTIKDINW